MLASKDAIHALGPCGECIILHDYGDGHVDVRYGRRKMRTRWEWLQYVPSPAEIAERAAAVRKRWRRPDEPDVTVYPDPGDVEPDDYP